MLSLWYIWDFCSFGMRGKKQEWIPAVLLKQQRSLKSEIRAAASDKLKVISLENASSALEKHQKRFAKMYSNFIIAFLETQYDASIAGEVFGEPWEKEACK